MLKQMTPDISMEINFIFDNMSVACKPASYIYKLMQQTNEIIENLQNKWQRKLNLNLSHEEV